MRKLLFESLFAPPLTEASPVPDDAAADGEAPALGGLGRRRDPRAPPAGAPKSRTGTAKEPTRSKRQPRNEKVASLDPNTNSNGDSGSFGFLGGRKADDGNLHAGQRIGHSHPQVIVAMHRPNGLV